MYCKVFDIIMKKKFIYSIFSSFFTQIITILCGLILPAFMIQTYGSEVYGATASILKFLGYITLLEGGIGSVVMAALYKPLHEKNYESLSRILSYTKRYFRVIVIIFVAYTLILALSFNTITKDSTLDSFVSFWLVIVISFSSIAQYYFGICNTLLLQADQKQYIEKNISSAALIVNTAVSCILCVQGANIIFLKLAASMVYVFKVLALNYYVKKHYPYLTYNLKTENELPQKWSGFGQHIACFVYDNTDVAVLTLFSGLKEVSVYSVYAYIFQSTRIFIFSFVANMQSSFGEIIASANPKRLHSFFLKMEFLMNTSLTVGFSTAAVMILPFIQIYTKGFDDAQYEQPVFAFILILAQMITAIRHPYHMLAMANGDFKKTAWAAYAEAIINIIISLLLCFQYGLLGVAVGTLVSAIFRLCYYVYYLKSNLIYRSYGSSIKRMLITFFCFFASVAVGQAIIKHFYFYNSYFYWCIFAIIVFAISALITGIASYIFYKEQLTSLVGTIVGMIRAKLKPQPKSY